MRYDAVIFDLLTALIDSWTLWNDVAGSPEDGMRWRRRYLDITYGCGAYRPYETLVREAARDVGLPESRGDALERRWSELKPWPEARRARGASRAPGGGDQLLAAPGRRGGPSDRGPVQGRGHGRKRGLLQAAARALPGGAGGLGNSARANPVRRRLCVGRARRQGCRHAGLLAHRIGLPPRDDAVPDHLEPTLDKLADLFGQH